MATMEIDIRALRLVGKELVLSVIDSEIAVGGTIASGITLEIGR